MMDISHYTFAQTHRTYNINSEPFLMESTEFGRLWRVSVGSSAGTNVPPVEHNVDDGKAMDERRQGVHRESLPSSAFRCEPQMALIKVFTQEDFLS